MFKPARWWSDKNKIRVDFKLRFHASQVTTDGLVVSFAPSESSRPTGKSEKAIVRDGMSCVWESPVYETVKFTRDSKTGKFHPRMYYFIVESLRCGVVGEASINFADYAEARKASHVSLPLNKDSKTELAMLHISIQRIDDDDDDDDECDESENAVDPHLDNRATDNMPFIKAFSSGESDVTLSGGSETSSGIEPPPWDLRTTETLLPDILIEKLKSENKARQKNLWAEEESYPQSDSRAVIEELKQELNHAKELNANLEIQLRKTQDSNSELILAVQDLDQMLLEHKKRSSSSFDEDDEQKALEELVKEHSNDRRELEYLQDQQMVEICKREKEELEMQMEQLALDYEIMKQSNHELANKLQQSQIQEQLKIQYECSSPDELETHIENLEEELKTRSNECVNSLDRIQALEEELEKQARGFEADLKALSLEKVEQEQRAIRAEDTLKKIRWKNANTAERLQEEFRRLSMQMASTFEANERLATKSMAEANELRVQKSRLEDMLCKEKESVENLRDEIETQVAKNKILLEEVESKKVLTSEMERMRISVKEKELLVEQGSEERVELERMVALMKSEAEESVEELNKMRCLVKEKESMIANMQSEFRELEESGLEKERVRKQQVLQLRSELKKREEALSVLEKKIKLDAVKATSKTSKPKERIKLLKSEIKSKQTDHEKSAIAFLEKEKDMRRKIEELEGRLEVYKSIEKPVDEVKNIKQMKLVEEKSKWMEEELQEMQERYLDISLKFAEVEGERQQLIMKLRNLTNANKSC